MMGHKIVIYDGPEYPYKKRWMCTCGILMPRVPFGLLLENAFRQHIDDAKKRMSKA